MDLTDSLYLNILNAFAKTLNASMLQANARIPATRGKNHAYDCWLINAYHKYLQKEHKQPIDTIRAAFPEGDLLGDGRSAIHMQNHIQWAICNPACIVGYFRPMINE